MVIVADKIRQEMQVGPCIRKSQTRRRKPVQNKSPTLQDAEEHYNPRLQTNDYHHQNMFGPKRRLAYRNNLECANRTISRIASIYNVMSVRYVIRAATRDGGTAKYIRSPRGPQAAKPRSLHRLLRPEPAIFACSSRSSSGGRDERT